MWKQSKVLRLWLRVGPEANKYLNYWLRVHRYKSRVWGFSRRKGERRWLSHVTKREEKLPAWITFLRLHFAFDCISPTSELAAFAPVSQPRSQLSRFSELCQTSTWTAAWCFMRPVIYRASSNSLAMPRSLSRVNLRNFLCAAWRLSSDAIVKINVNKQNFQFWNAFEGINKRLRDVNSRKVVLPNFSILISRLSPF